MSDIEGIARQVYIAQVDETAKAINEVISAHSLKRAVICGMGSFIAKDALFKLGIPFTTLSKDLSDEISKVFPAYAVAYLLEKELDNAKE